MIWTYASPRKKREKKESPHPKYQNKKREPYKKGRSYTKFKYHTLAHFDQTA
jgi:hypothetical protein